MNRQLISQPSSPPVFRPSIEGDPAARRFGWYLLVTLGAMTIGAVVGIIAGNIAHYRYSDPIASTNLSLGYLLNETNFLG